MTWDLTIFIGMVPGLKPDNYLMHKTKLTCHNFANIKGKNFEIIILELDT